MFQIHPEFKLASKSFHSTIDLIEYLMLDFETDALFLKELFDDKDFIVVKTSGSTGTPKTIKLPKRALLKSAENTAKFFDLPPKTKALHCLSSQFIAGKMMWVRALHLGWHLTLKQPNNHPLENNNETFDFAAMVPLQVQNSFEQLHQIKTLIIGGAPLSDEMEQKLETVPSNIFLTYGMTETITHIAVRKIGKDIKFKCLPEIEIAKDFRDCLEIKVPYISDEVLKTNDLVEIYDDNSFLWLGRYDSVINSGGIKFIPEIIEKKIEKFIRKPFIISSKYDENLGEKMVLVIESKPYEIDLNILNFELEKYEKLKEIFFINEFSKTENGKIKRIDVKNKLNK